MKERKEKWKEIVNEGIEIVNEIMNEIDRNISDQRFIGDEKYFVSRYCNVIFRNTDLVFIQIEIDEFFSFITCGDSFQWLFFSNSSTFRTWNNRRNFLKAIMIDLSDIERDA
jgi:hypothetical protein